MLLAASCLEGELRGQGGGFLSLTLVGRGSEGPTQRPLLQSVHQPDYVQVRPGTYPSSGNAFVLSRLEHAWHLTFFQEAEQTLTQTQ